MKIPNELVEEQLKELLDDLLQYGNQNGAIKSIKYNPQTETCNIEMSVVITEEDGNPIPIITFAGY